MGVKLERLTYVDDEPDILAIARFVLHEIGGYDVDLCASGAEALERTPKFMPDLILLDVMMPDLDGIETFKRLSAVPDLERTPMVFVTAKAMQGEWKLYRNLGIADVITKPFDPMTLCERVEKTWRSCHA